MWLDCAFGNFGKLYGSVFAAKFRCWFFEISEELTRKFLGFSVVVWSVLGVFFLQKRNIWSNVRLIMIPFYLCIVLVSIQALFDSQVNNSVDNQCGCKCIDKIGVDKCEMICGVEYSSRGQGVFCAIPNPQPWPPMVLIPRPQARAVDANFTDDSCRRKNSCPVTILFTGNNQSLGASMLFSSSSSSSGISYIAGTNVCVFSSFVSKSTQEVFYNELLWPLV